MIFEIPGQNDLDITCVVMDFNGTIAVDGKLKKTVKPLIIRLAERFRVCVITSDTQGTAAEELCGMPVTLLIYNTVNAGECKRKIVEELGSNRCACIGNGNNDRFMFQAAALSIAVLESERLYAPLLADADMLFRSGEDALELLLNPKRLISGLRT